MTTRTDIIYARIQDALHPELLQVIDESDQHVGHAGHMGGGRHFAVIITASSLAHLSRVAQHREIYKLFADMMPDQIHALRIVVK